MKSLFFPPLKETTTQRKMYTITFADDSTVTAKNVASLFAPVVAAMEAMGIPEKERPRRAADLYYLTAPSAEKSDRLKGIAKHVKQFTHEYKRYTYKHPKNADLNARPKEQRVIPIVVPNPKTD